MTYNPRPYVYTGVSLPFLGCIEDSQFSLAQMIAYACFVKIMIAKINIFYIKW
ncbi:hypothetical protein EMIT036CA2_10504 [Chryseobacterium sp. IT-36CA2]